MNPSTLIEGALRARGVYPSTRLPLGRTALDSWRTRLAGELLKALANDYDLVPRGEHARLRSAAARALERIEVSCDTSGAASEAEAILSEVITIDGSSRPTDRQLGVCPHCGATASVTNPETDLFVCGRPGERGCGAQWRGARLGTPA